MLSVELDQFSCTVLVVILALDRLVGAVGAVLSLVSGVLKSNICEKSEYSEKSQVFLIRKL